MKILPQKNRIFIIFIIIRRISICGNYKKKRKIICDLPNREAIRRKRRTKLVEEFSRFFFKHKHVLS